MLLATDPSDVAGRPCLSRVTWPSLATNRAPVGGGRTACSPTVKDDAFSSDSDDCDFLSLRFLRASNAALASAGVRSVLMYICAAVY